MEVPKKSASAKKGGRKGRKLGRNKRKCEAYRIRVGKPNGPGQPGNKS